MKNHDLNTFIEWAIKARADVLAMSVRDQIIVYALLIAIAVLSLALTYWVVKGSLALTYVAIKGSLYLSYYAVVLSLLILFGLLKITIELVRSAFQKPIYRPTKTANISKLTLVLGRESRRHCPQCGKEFSNAMEEAMHKNGNTFCESCGVKAEIRV